VENGIVTKSARGSVGIGVLIINLRNKKLLKPRLKQQLGVQELKLIFFSRCQQRLERTRATVDLSDVVVMSKKILFTSVE